jgi:hypothetical protein
MVQPVNPDYSQHPGRHKMFSRFASRFFNGDFSNSDQQGPSDPPATKFGANIVMVRRFVLLYIYIRSAQPRRECLFIGMVVTLCFWKRRIRA